MKKTSRPLLAASLLLTVWASAQEAAPAPAPVAPAPAQVTPDPLPDPANADPFGLIPEMPAPGKRPKGGGGSKGGGALLPGKSSTEQTADQIQLRLRFRQVKTKALLDQAIVDEWNRAHLVKTDREKREGLRNYYKLLYTRMLKIDPKLKPQVEVAQKVATSRLEQRGIKGAEATGADDVIEPLEEN